MINVQAAHGAMKIIAAMAIGANRTVFGTPQPDLEIVMGDDPWLSSNRQTVCNVLDALCFGTIDEIGIPRIDVPVEYRASVIAMFVSPINIHAACRFWESGAPTSEHAQGGALKKASAEQMFAIVLQIMSDANQYRSQWEKSVNFQVDVKKGTKNEKE